MDRQLLGWLSLIIAIVSNAAASVLLKSAMKPASSAGNLWRWETLWGLSPSVLLYALAFAAYASSLKSLPLHISHPLSTAVPIVIVAIASVLVFHEQVNGAYLAGLLLIVTGAVIIGVFQ